jgi:dihydrodipicolinate synthase/N-acetylneuraminate lyase
MYEMTRIIEMGSEPWSVFSGMDEQCVFAAMCGAHGAIGSSINVMPGVYREIRRLVAADKQAEAWALQQQSNRILTILISYGYPAALRAALGVLGFECGVPRLPELALGDLQAEKLGSELSEAGFQRLAAM